MAVQATNLDRKFSQLKKIIGQYGDMVLAMSGGKDSALVLAAAVQVLDPCKLVALTSVSPVKRPDEEKYAARLCRQLGAVHRIVATSEHTNPVFINDPSRRCQLCKQELFDRMKEQAKESGLKTLADGANYDDVQKDRPVDALSAQNNVRHPLVEAGLGTADVTALLTHIGLAEYVRPHHTSCQPWETLFTEKS